MDFFAKLFVCILKKTEIESLKKEIGTRERIEKKTFTENFPEFGDVEQGLLSKKDLLGIPEIKLLKLMTIQAFILKALGHDTVVHFQTFLRIICDSINDDKISNSDLEVFHNIDIYEEYIKINESFIIFFLINNLATQ